MKQGAEFASLETRREMRTGLHSTLSIRAVRLLSRGAARRARHFRGSHRARVFLLRLYVLRSSLYVFISPASERESERTSDQRSERSRRITSRVTCPRRVRSRAQTLSRRGRLSEGCELCSVYFCILACVWLCLSVCQTGRLSRATIASTRERAALKSAI